MKRCCSLSLFLAAAAALCPATAAAQPATIRVVAFDIAGVRIRSAEGTVVAAQSDPIFCTTSDGELLCSLHERGDATLAVSASGFETLHVRPTAEQIAKGQIEVTLAPASIKESLVVSANRVETTIGDSPASIVTLSRSEVMTAAAPTMDDALRQVPGFSIFRRSSSRNANPTTQGVSLRGVGASGASRSLVLFDGVPLNDPFGGWVQWNRLPVIAIEAVEVFRGGASSLYGDSSISGLINIRPRGAGQVPEFSSELFGGSQNSLGASGFVGGKYGKWFADVAAGHFQTRGFIPVVVSERGSVDSFAGVRSGTFSGRFGRTYGDRANVFFRPSYFSEARTNGTSLQINRTHSRQFALGGTVSHFDTIDVRRPGFSIEWRVFAGAQVYDQTFSAVAANRTSESLTRIQRSPAQNLGFSAQLSTNLRNHTIVVGTEGLNVRGSSDETILINGVRSALVGAGGRERAVGFFAQDLIAIGARVVLSGSIRYDAWSNLNGYNNTRNLITNDLSALKFGHRDESAWSPRISVLVHGNAGLAFHLGASKNFRAPTLNELYRSFRVGNVITNANENLLAERSGNFEGGASFGRGRTYVRANVFQIDLEEAVANVTVAITPSLITRQRQNAGRTRTRGIEIDAETRFRDFTLSAGYLFADSHIDRFPSNLVLVGKLIPQVPRHHFTFQSIYTANRWILAIQGRASSAQFDDDLNQFRLEPLFQLDVFASKRLGRHVNVFAAIENVFNSRYSVGRTPVRTLNSSAIVRIGFRWN
jgi:outer membrane receptor protein involved in Fe transport